MASSIKFRPLTGLLIVVAAVFVVIGVVYLTKTAGQLPAFFPGHTAGSTHKHTKHAIAVFSLAALTLVGAWFSTAPSHTDAQPPASDAP